MSRVKHKTICL